ncbi:hypothetical protein ACFYSW_29905 [Rhodococcus aetherivorans]|uniref:hypothetical protein n=1 Tax=Rhodococcus aetherivorans TaxID=191292 RepID=UPI0036CB5AAF
MALRWMAPLQIAVLGAAACLLGMAGWSLLHRRVGATVASVCLGIFVVPLAATMLDLLDAL